MSYRLGFWVLSMILAGCVIAGYLILDSYGKSPSDVLHRVFGISDDIRDIQLHYAWLPDHYTAHVGPLPYSYTGNVETLKDFYDWKHAPGGVLAEYEDRPTTRDVTYGGVEIMETQHRDSHRFAKHAMLSFFDTETILFYELLPNSDSAQHDAVFVIPGSGHTGAADVLGEQGRWQGYYYQDGIARTLAEAGYAVYVIELRGYGERALDVGMACNTKGDPSTCSSFAVENKMAVFGLDMGDIRTDEITQVLAYIESRSYIRDVAVAGLSLGAGLAANQAIINGDVVDAVVMASGVMSSVYSPLNMEMGGSETVSCCDTVDRLATIAPMPAYVSFGKQETTAFRWEAESGYTGSFLADVYWLHNASGNLYYMAHDGPHQYHVDSVLDFLDMHLGR